VFPEKLLAIQGTYDNLLLVAGSGATSTRELIKLTNDAAEAGADYAIVTAGGFYAGAFANNRAAMKAFFSKVAESSHISILIWY